MARRFTKYPSSYVKASSDIDYSQIKWKSQPASLLIKGKEAPYMCYSKDLGNGYYADVYPQYREAFDEIEWVATIKEYSNSSNGTICGFSTFDNAYDAQQWVDYDGHNYTT